jgi:23S rRNA pseudouridine2605 synthase
MRINQFVAQATGLSRRSVDKAITEGRVKVNDELASLGQDVKPTDKISLNDTLVLLPSSKTIILMNKPVNYVCSRDGQGSSTIYDLLPEKYHKLKSIGRLDKDSSGLVLLTDDGELAYKLGHPKFDKPKIYELALDKPLSSSDKELIETGQVLLEGKPSTMQIKQSQKNPRFVNVEIYEGRNRQIRRTFSELNYTVRTLNRVSFGPYKISELGTRRFIEVSS